MNEVKTESGTVTVTNTNPRVLYYRGRYFRTTVTIATTPDNFVMTNRATFFGQPYGLRWFMSEGSGMWNYYRYDSTKCSWLAPF